MSPDINDLAEIKVVLRDVQERLDRGNERLNKNVERLEEANLVAAEHNRLITEQTQQLRIRTIATIVVAAFLALAVLGMALAVRDSQQATAKVQQITEQNRRDIANEIHANNLLLCPAFGGLSSGPPPTTERGKWTVNLFTQLFRDYRCPPESLDGIPGPGTP